MCTYPPRRSALRTARQRETWGLAKGLILSLLMLPALVSAQERALRFDRITGEDGLSNDSVWAIHQDTQGFLWLGTAEGLNRYDGYSFRVYRHDPDDPASLSSSSVHTIASDSQSDLWIGTEDGGLNHYRREDATFVRYRHIPGDPTSLPHDSVTSLLQDHSGDLWVGTANGLARLRQRQGAWVVETPAAAADSLSDHLIEVLHQDRSGSLWAGTDRGLIRFNAESGAVSEVRHDPDDPGSLTGGLASAIEEDSEGRLWIATAQGLNRLDPKGGIITHPARDLLASPDMAEAQITALQLDRQGELWIGILGGGLVRFDPARGNFSHSLQDPTDPHSLASNLVISLFEDRTGVMWAGSLPGLSRYDPARDAFAVYRPLPGRQTTLADDDIWALTEDRSGTLWVGTPDSGLDRVDRERRTVVNYRHDPRDPHSLQPGPVTILREDRSGTLWIGTWGGLSWLDPSAERPRFVHYPTDPDDPSRLSNNKIQSLHEDSSGRLWIGTLAGLHRFDREAQRFVRYPELPGDAEELGKASFYAIHEGASGSLWFGSAGGGVYRLEDDQVSGHTDSGERFRNYRNDPDDRASLSSNVVLSLLVDHSGVLWVGTGSAGLNRLEQSADGEPSDGFTRYWIKDGLPSDSILGILEDGEGRLWLSTGNGLSRFDPEAETFRNYDTGDGLSGNSFGAACDFRSPSGEMFFGSSGGVTAFFPERITDDPTAPAVAITDFLLFNTSVPLAGIEPGSPLVAPISETRELTLSHRDYVFAFEFAALHFASPLQNHYAYRLEGFDSGWVRTDASKRFAQYSNIAPGDYIFRVKAANDDGVWNEDGASLRVRVLPAPWKTWWAYTLYGLALVGALVLFVQSQRRKVERERSINERLLELDRMKDEFLANTSHELRTPLYGMTGLAESLLDGARGVLPQPVRSDLNMLVASGRRLSGLVNDILDVARLQRSGLELDHRPVDLRVLVDVVLTLSRPLAGSKDLVLRNAIPEDLPAVDADENRLEQILHNLIGNAIKFTESGKVVVSARRDEDRLAVSVADTGIGIPADQLDRIFEVFEQVDASEKRAFGGTGLGLAITRELVELHGGALTVESIPGSGSTFRFSLPLAVADAAPSSSRRPDREPEAIKPETITRGPAITEPQPLGDGQSERRGSVEPVPARGDGRHILVVDDEPVIRQVLVNQLAAGGYQVTPAASGREALRLIDAQPPDLVLLDVMMPGMSGYEVCDRLRTHRPPEELPVIFLTAKNQVADLVAGFAAQANDYLTKPLSKPELLARVDAHLELLAAHRRLDRLVAERTAQSEERQQLIQELKARNSELTRFTYTVSHDLKSPLVTIKGFLGLLERDAENGQFERMRHDIKRIHGAADRMQQLLEDLLVLSRAGRLLNPLADVDVGELAREALGQVAALMTERGVDVEIAPDLPMVRADRLRLLEVLQNLLENAAKYMGDQPSPRIEVGARSDRPVPIIYVRDNGMGIEPRYHDVVFGLFQRLDVSGNGTGVGLALVKRIVEIHGGEVWVESEGSGQGSTFCFTLEPASETRAGAAQADAAKRTPRSSS